MTVRQRTGERSSVLLSTVTVFFLFSRKILPKALEQAPKRLKTVFDEMYVKAKTQKAYAAERGVTEKYIQILNKRLLLYLQANMAEG